MPQLSEKFKISNQIASKKVYTVLAVSLLFSFVLVIIAALNWVSVYLIASLVLITIYVSLAQIYRVQKSELRSATRAIEAAMLEERYLQAERASDHAISIYQMGKVGSSSVRRTLAGLGLKVTHFHTIDHDRAGRLSDDEITIRKIEVNSSHSRIISLVRDPVARNVSAFFQNHAAFDGEMEGDISTETLIEEFFDDYPHSLPLTWFDTEFRANTGIDVYEHDFPKSIGYQIIEDEGKRLLIAKLEIGDDGLARGLREFLRYPTPIDLQYSNRAEDKGYKNHYREFLRRVKFPEDYLLEMYDSKHVKHFYSDQEISGFLKRWSGKEN